jgi:hypothetical protein
MYDMSPHSDPSYCKVVLADGRIDQKFVTKTLDLPNAHFIDDHWHLMYAKLPKAFGSYHFNLYKASLKTMLQARTQELYDSSCRELKDRVKG